MYYYALINKTMYFIIFVFYILFIFSIIFYFMETIKCFNFDFLILINSLLISIAYVIVSKYLYFILSIIFFIIFSTMYLLK